MQEYASIWHDTLALIKMQIPQSNFTTMFAKTCIKEIKDDVVLVGCPNSFTKSWIENNQSIITKNALTKIIGKNINVTFTVYSPPRDEIKFEKDSLFAQNEDNTSNLSNPFSNTKQVLSTPGINGLNPKYTFDNFIIGSSNRLAHAAALAVCDKPGVSYNPFFLYGKVGLGKTHLMHSIGNEILKKHSEMKVMYTSSETFLNEMIKSIQTNKMDNFRKKYREIDVLMIDDIQFISGKVGTQEEFFHTFNSLHQANKQIILASDRPPREISKLEERIRSRLEGGMVADINTPDFEMRVAILQKKLEGKDTTLSSDILNLIAGQYVNNIRELEGALTKVIAFRSISTEELTENSIKKILDIPINNNRQRLKPKDILDKICNEYGVTIKQLKSERRTASIANTRQIAMYFLRNELDLPLKDIATILGRKDHTTIIHGVKKIEMQITKNIGFRDEINNIRGQLKDVL